MPAASTTHNPDRYMGDLRQILAQGKKRIGLLVGAGAPTAIKVNPQGQITDDGEPLIPDVARLTAYVLQNLSEADRSLIEKLRPELGTAANIETILTRLRRIGEAIGNETIYGLNGAGFQHIGERICEQIGHRVGATLPAMPNAYSELVSWIGGTHREHAVEIFTPNYDLLLEEAFERARLPYFDGFTGAHRPFFDPASISENRLPVRWSRIWKLHGSLGWDVQNDMIVRTGSRQATKLIYPDHRKYDAISREPYSALFARLSDFLTTPDTLLICSGFSFFDSHICAVLDEALSANAHTAVFAFQFRALAQEDLAVKLAINRPNLSVYARDGAIIAGIEGAWQPGQLPNEEWDGIRRTFWKFGSGGQPNEFLLGDFSSLSRFFALTQASRVVTPHLQIEQSTTSGDDGVGGALA